MSGARSRWDTFALGVTHRELIVLRKHCGSPADGTGESPSVSLRYVMKKFPVKQSDPVKVSARLNRRQRRSAGRRPSVIREADFTVQSVYPFQLTRHIHV